MLYGNFHLVLKLTWKFLNNVENLSKHEDTSKMLRDYGQ